MGTDAQGAHDEQRWAKAQALLSNPQDEAILRDLRRRRQRTLVIFAAVMVGLVIAALVIGFLVAGSDDESSSSNPLWLQIVGMACTVACAVVIATYLIKGRRAGLFGLGPLSVLNQMQLRSLRRQVLGQQPVEPEHLTLLRRLAGRMARQKLMLLLPIGLVLGQLGSFLLSPSLWKSCFLAILVLAFLAAGIQIRRDGQRAQRFLAEHPEQPETAVTAE